MPVARRVDQPWPRQRRQHVPTGATRSNSNRLSQSGLASATIEPSQLDRGWATLRSGARTSYDNGQYVARVRACVPRPAGQREVQAVSERQLQAERASAGLRRTGPDEVRPDDRQLPEEHLGRRAAQERRHVHRRGERDHRRHLQVGDALRRRGRHRQHDEPAADLRLQLRRRHLSRLERRQLHVSADQHHRGQLPQLGQPDVGDLLRVAQVLRRQVAHRGLQLRLGFGRRDAGPAQRQLVRSAVQYQLLLAVERAGVQLERVLVRRRPRVDRTRRHRRFRQDGGQRDRPGRRPRGHHRQRLLHRSQRSERQRPATARRSRRLAA